MKEPTSTVRQEVERISKEIVSAFGSSSVLFSQEAKEKCVRDSLSTLLQRIEECVPEEKVETWTINATLVHDKEAASWNACRTLMLTNLKGLKGDK